jgi:hypothetical protein
VFGLDTPAGRPDNLVPLFGQRVWGTRWLSRDASEGTDKVSL